MTYCELSVFETWLENCPIFDGRCEAKKRKYVRICVEVKSGHALRSHNVAVIEPRKSGDHRSSKMAHTGRKIRLCDRDVYPAITEGPANVFSSIPFLLVKARYDIKLKTCEVVYIYIS